MREWTARPRPRLVTVLTRRGYRLRCQPEPDPLLGNVSGDPLTSPSPVAGRVLSPVFRVLSSFRCRLVLVMGCPGVRERRRRTPALGRSLSLLFPFLV